MKMTLEEAARILDPETRMDALDAYTYDLRFQFELCEEACRIAAAALREKLAGNEPITLDELRTMQSKPVWIKRQDGGTSRWAIVVDFASLYGVFFYTEKGGLRLPYDECGKTWLAYRRKPEVQK